MSKNTKYFDSVQDVNNYYPDGVPSNVIAIVGDGSNVFISSDNAGSRNQQYYSADMTNDEIVAEQVQAAEQQGYDAGYAAGEAAGGEWEPIESFTYGLQDLYDGTVDSLDIYWGNITAPFTKEAILDNETGDVTGYRFIWEIGTVEVGQDLTESVLVVHEEYPVNVQTNTWATTANGKSADYWFETFIDQDTGEFIDDLYDSVYPVIKNVTMTQPQGGYQYNGTTFNILLDFEELVYEDYLGDACEDAENITENGIYPNNPQSYFNVNVESGSSMTLEDLTIFERGKFMTQLGQTYAHPGYSWEFYKDVDTRWFKNVFDQNPDYLYFAFKTHSTNSAQIVCYKINDENEVDQVQLTLQAYNLDPTEDPETGDMRYTVGGYGYFTLNLNAGDKVGFYVILKQYEAHYLLTKDAYDDSTTQMTDHWFTANETGTYMMKYEITEYNETDMYYTIEGSFTKVNT